MKTRLLFALLFTFHIFSLTAQSTENELLKKLVEKNILTQQEAEDIAQQEQAKEVKPTVSKIREAFNSPYMKLGGYMMLTYNYKEYSEVHHSVDPRLALVSMTGTFNRFKYYLLHDFAHNTMYEVYGEWSKSKALNLKGGIQKVPYSIENQMSLTNIESIYNTRSVSALVGMGGDVQALNNNVNNTGRDMGVQVYGSLIRKEDYNLIEYAAGLFQGTGIKKGTRAYLEDNGTKDFVASLLFRPIKELRIGGSAYFGQANYKMGSETSPVPHVRNRLIASGEYNSNRFYARSESIWANDGGVKKLGIHSAIQYYIIPQKMNLAGKVDYLNTNKEAKTSVMDYTLAANYYFHPSCRFQINYVYSDYSKEWEGGRNCSSVIAQMQVVF